VVHFGIVCGMVFAGLEFLGKNLAVIIISLQFVALDRVIASRAGITS
jgi:hypothetical protein